VTWYVNARPAGPQLSEGPQLIKATRSLDGLVWSPSVTLNPNAPLMLPSGAQQQSLFPHLAAGGNGTVVVVWTSEGARSSGRS
jgi:hypothetical protein